MTLLLLVTTCFACAVGGSDTVDSTAADAAVPDGGEMDASGNDASPSDAGSSDAGSLDAGPSDAGSSDAGPSDAEVVDASDAGTLRCDWSYPVVVLDVLSLSAEVNSDFNETEPFVTADGLTLYFSSNRTGAGDVYMSTRASVTGDFGTPSLVAWGHSSTRETRFETSADGLTGYLAADLAGGLGGSDLYVSTRVSLAAPFSSFTSLSGLNSAANEFDAHITADGLHLYFSNDTASHSQIFLSTRATTSGAFGPPAVVTQLSDSYQNANATFTADESVVVFTSTRPITTGATDANIWYSVRGSRGGELIAPQPMPAPVNYASSTEYEPFITQDGCEVYFTSTRHAPDDDDLFVARIAP